MRASSSDALARATASSASTRAARARSASSATRNASMSSGRSSGLATMPRSNHKSRPLARKKCALVIRRVAAGTYDVGFASQFLPAKAYRNIPCSEADEASIDEIKVLDRRHPLYGRSFRVLRRSTHRGGNFPPSYEVEYRNGSSLLIPVAATEWHDSPNDQLKLCLEALRDLVHAVDCLDSHDEHKTKRSLDDTVAGSEAASGRPPRRCPGGGRS